MKSFEQTEEDLAKINRYTRRDLTMDEVYCFKVILCDNEVDRDYESFTVGALKELAVLFLGKTGIFDHNPKGENQTARIYDTEVLEDPTRKTQFGQVYTYLQAKAYMVRSEKNADLILEIDAGIKKEVSVGCSVASVKCSICGTNLKEQFCEHVKGVQYNNQLCYAMLDQPTDAYEWSFVAVPAQKNAGVTKRYDERCHSHSLEPSEHAVNTRSAEELIKLFGIAERSVFLSKEETKQLKKEFERLTEQAALGNQYMTELRKRVKTLSYLDSPQLTLQTIHDVVDKMSYDELKAYEKMYEARLGKGGSQLFHPETSSENQNTEFKI